MQGTPFDAGRKVAPVVTGNRTRPCTRTGRNDFRTVRAQPVAAFVDHCEPLWRTRLDENNRDACRMPCPIYNLDAFRWFHFAQRIADYDDVMSREPGRHV